MRRVYGAALQSALRPALPPLPFHDPQCGHKPPGLARCTNGTKRHLKIAEPNGVRFAHYCTRHGGNVEGETMLTRKLCIGEYDGGRAFVLAERADDLASADRTLTVTVPIDREFLVRWAQDMVAAEYGVRIIVGAEVIFDSAA